MDATGQVRHGTPHGYRNRRCRCARCHAAVRAYDHYRARQIAYGRWQPWGDAEAVRAHVDHLIEHGWTHAAVARAAGVDESILRRIANGRLVRVRARDAERLLAVRLTQRPRRGYVPAAGTVRRLRALAVLGHGLQALSQATGVSTTALSQLRAGRPGQGAAGRAGPAPLAGLDPGPAQAAGRREPDHRDRRRLRSRPAPPGRPRTRRGLTRRCLCPPRTLRGGRGDRPVRTHPPLLEETVTAHTSTAAPEPVATDTGIYAPIGTDTDQNPVLWRLSDAHGRPAHGLITGWSGAGATVLLGHLLTAAAQAGITTWYLDEHAPHTTTPASWHTKEPAAFFEALEELYQKDEGSHGLLVAIDHPRAVEEYGPLLHVMAAIGTMRGIGFVLRTPDLSQRRLNARLREQTSTSQYLLFDHGAHTGPTRLLAESLPGYTAPARPRTGSRQACGRGRYGRGGTCRPVTVTAP